MLAKTFGLEEWHRKCRLVVPCIDASALTFSINLDVHTSLNRKMKTPLLI